MNEPVRPPTPSQTAGPFVSIGTGWSATDLVVVDDKPGAITVAGRVFDGSGVPVIDAMLEFWQADPRGRFPPESLPTWTGFTRALTDGEGRYRSSPSSPGRSPDLREGCRRLTSTFLYLPGDCCKGS